MNQFEAMRIFVRVAELGSFTRAAEQVGLPKASISTIIKQLENLLSIRLLHRTTRSVQMTADGQIYYERCKDMLADMEELQTLFQQGEGQISGRLRMDLPSAFARNIVIPRLPEFLRHHPRLEIELSSTDRKVDLIREGFDCVMRIGNLSDSSLIARPLGTLRQINCASPAYIATHGMPARLEELSAHQLIHYASHFGGKSAGFEYVEDGKSKSIAMSGILTVNSSDAYQAACLAGFGITQAPAIGATELIAQGRLVEILPDFTAASMPVSLLYADRRYLPKRTQSWMSWVAEIVQPYLDPQAEYQ